MSAQSYSLKDFEKMRNLIDELNARTAEYDTGHPTISDAEWDKKYFVLQELEEKTGTVYPDSPTSSISYSVVNSLEKVTHSHPMLSLAKTKSIEDIKTFGGINALIAMAKLDGLTCSLRYENGKLVMAETRGNGAIGENILHNALVIPSIPKEINFKDTLVVDGEVICTYQNYERFKDTYKNPRNFAAGSIRLLDSKECNRRNLTFVAWDVITGFEKYETLSSKLMHLGFLGFYIVPYQPFMVQDNALGEGTVETAIKLISKKAENNSYPIDGIVFKYDDCEEYNAKGATAHHFRGGIAYKFVDEEYETELLNIEWSMGRKGVLTPVAIFNPVEIDDTIVERASLHNIDVMYETMNGGAFVGEKISIIKANQIIPQIVKAEKEAPSNAKLIPIPKICPYCGEPTKIKTLVNTRELFCTNSSCPAKLSNIIDHFVSKKGLDIKGLSINTIDFLIDKGWLNNILDVFNLKEHKNEWVKENGFGEKSVSNILNAIEERMKSCDLSLFISSLSIPLIGLTYAKQLTEYFKTWDSFIFAAEGKFDFSTLNGFGGEMDSAIHNYDYTLAKEIAQKINFNSITAANKTDNCKDLIFVITGKVQKWKNRDELKAAIEAAGGKVTNSVTKNTSYLVNNDINSTTSKNETAKKLGVPIITEDELLRDFLKT